VQTRVPLRVFTVFISAVQGGSFTLSEGNCEFLRLLAEEFRFKDLSVQCSEFLGLQCPSDGLSEEESVSVDEEPLPLVRITVKKRSRTFETLDSFEEMKDFAIFLSDAKAKDIAIDGVEGTDHIVEKAIATVYTNTAASMLDTDAGKKPHLALILWTMHMFMDSARVTAITYSLNRLNALAPTGFEKARLLLISQCHPSRPCGFRPGGDADWYVIGNATLMLETEKNGQKASAKQLLEKLKSTGRYSSVLGKSCDSLGTKLEE
jgi:hypothetical protein